MINLVELDIEVMIHIVSNKYMHHEILYANTYPCDIFPDPYINTGHFINNEDGIEHLHTDRIDDIKSRTYEKKSYNTKIKEQCSTRHPRVDEMSMETYQMLIDETANLLRSPLNFKNNI
jgi:hypothetical protein